MESSNQQSNLSDNHTSFLQISKLKSEIEKLKTEKLKLEKCYYCCQLGHYQKKCLKANRPIFDDDHQGLQDHRQRLFEAKLRAMTAEQYEDYMECFE